MHDFSDLANRCTIFTLNSLKDVEEKTIEALQTSGATSLVMTLQMTRLERTILAVGMFSIFEALLQDRLNCNNGFAEAKDILKKAGDLHLLTQFTDLELAINALKHGRGRSYNTIVANDGGAILSKVKSPNEHFFDEGDVSEISTLIDVDDKFIHSCVQIISQVSESIKNFRPGVVL
jgi:hypothetical protein